MLFEDVVEAAVAAAFAPMTPAAPPPAASGFGFAVMLPSVLKSVLSSRPVPSSSLGTFR